MKFKLFLGIGGERFHAERFQQRAAIPGSRVKQIGHRGQEIDPVRFRAWNVLESPRIDGSNDPGDDVVAVLDNNAAALRLLEKERTENVACWVGIVCYHLEGEAPRGFSFDANTISALARAGARLEINAVYDTAEIEKHLVRGKAGGD